MRLSPSATEDPPCRGGRGMLSPPRLNVLPLVWCSVVVRRGGGCHPQPFTEGLGSNLGEDMDVCKCIVILRHGVILNSRRAASSLVKLVDGEEGWKALSPGCSPSKLGWNRAKSYCHLYGAQGYGK
ncbi:hypothetical protein TNCV_2544321 [Trichonephila clavipes]|nr:hypothetical protein TNCV_2544321 [Trichonephila clavipes]